MVSVSLTRELALFQRIIGKRLATALLGVVVCLLLPACGSRTESRRPSLAEAWVGPIELHVRKEINPKSAVVGTVAHGEKVAVLEQRRIFARIRTSDGHEGWTEVRQLMTAEQMNELRSLTEQADALVSQGAAISYEPVNMHTAPDRNSPSFFQFREGTRVDVLAHKLAPRLPRSSEPVARLIPPRPKSEKKRGQTDDANSARRLRPPAAPAPGLPPDWEDLSKTGEPPEPAPEPAPPAPAAPPPMEDWTLVRTKEGTAGWVLTRMLVMAIPDEVAQYSEGHRITSYFAMKEMRDEDKLKYDWLWTTQSQTGVSFDFDSFRYFVWSQRHHRYETGYIQRNVVGYYPVKVTPGAQPAFSLILQGEDGKLYRNDFVMQGYRVHLANKVPWTPPAPGAVTQATPVPVPAGAQTRQPGLFQRLRDKVRGWFK